MTWLKFYAKSAPKQTRSWWITPRKHLSLSELFFFASFLSSFPDFRAFLSRCLFPTPEQDEHVLSRGCEAIPDFVPALFLNDPLMKGLLNETRDFLAK